MILTKASDFRDPGGRVALAIYNCRKITISAVNGHAVGAIRPIYLQILTDSCRLELVSLLCSSLLISVSYGLELR